MLRLLVANYLYIGILHQLPLRLLFRQTALSKISKSQAQLVQTPNLPGSIHPNAASFLFFPFFRPLPLFFFLLFHHPQSPEKRTQHLRALFFQHAALDLHLMVKLVHFQHI